MDHKNSEKYIAIGDIHGCARSLDALLDRITPCRDCIHVFIGDYIDRGPDSRQTVERLMRFSEEAECIFLMGNHEKMLLDSIEKNETDLWLINGGQDTLASYGVGLPSEIPQKHIDFFSATKPWFETADYLFIHAGLDPDRPVREQLQQAETEENGLWERNHVYTPTRWEKKVVFGHTPVPEPINEDRKIGIDTGCVYQHNGLGKLTAVLLPEESFIQQPCLD